PAERADVDVRPTGEICVLWQRQDSNRFWYSCGPDFEAMDTGLDVEVASTLHMVEYGGEFCIDDFCAEIEGTTAYFQGEFSSADAAGRSVFQDIESWGPIEVSESSISSFSDADMDPSGMAHACLLGALNQGAVFADGDRLRTVPTIGDHGIVSCRIAPTDTGTVSLMQAGGDESLQVLVFAEGSTASREPVAVEIPIDGGEYDIAANSDGIYVAWVDGLGDLRLSSSSDQGASWTPVSTGADPGAFGLRPLLERDGDTIALVAPMSANTGIAYWRWCAGLQ
ncbi:MAG: hypothetical protein KC561_14565, partial [Myxococcales bacterium]|nr:hypothetical protein [Myxococcales bacterium]